MTKVNTYPLISIRSDATVRDAAQLMADCSMSSVGVLGPDKEFAGIITERDLAWFVARGMDPNGTNVAELANDFPVVVEGPIDDAGAVAAMKKARVRHLIVKEGDELRMVSMRDFFVKFSGDEPVEHLTAREVMSAPAIACRDEAYFEEVAEILSDRDISGMPVVDEAGYVVGVVSERDMAHALGGPLVRLALRRHSDRSIDDVGGLPRGARKAHHAMTSPAITVQLETHLDEVGYLMRTHRVNRVPVLDGDRLVGVVTRGDVLAALAHLDHPPVDVTTPFVLLGSEHFVPFGGPDDATFQP